MATVGWLHVVHFFSVGSDHARGLASKRALPAPVMDICCFCAISLQQVPCLQAVMGVPSPVFTAEATSSGSKAAAGGFAVSIRLGCTILLS